MFPVLSSPRQTDAGDAITVLTHFLFHQFECSSHQTMKTSFLAGLLGLLSAALLAGATKVYRESVAEGAWVDGSGAAQGLT